MKIGIIRCRMTEDYCPGTSDFKAIRERSGVFAEVPPEEPIELIGFNNCGGCPGKKAVLRARELVKRGADTIVFASCIQKGNPIGYPCPFAKKMKEIIAGGATTILVSHSLEQVREMCNKVLWLDKGKQVAFGGTREICDKYLQFLNNNS